MRIALGAVGVLAGLALWAQESRTFEVASIRLRTPGTEAIPNSLGLVRISGSDVTASALTVRDLIFYGYSIRPFQLGAIEKWVADDRWNVLAKAAGPVAKEQVREMFRGLLADRFQLKLKREMKEMPVYALRFAAGGSKL
jgi:uncharacterized protein (TIGR03435 family)